ncbi:sugar kinase [Staphylococcus croceilyticus]|uniref:Sugar kinase n=1 Tax=Staphylococcus croceilyticus TaxID=319942 RepID=A0ABY2KGD7_9STAP|nr:sugar kinase [Staphylococcus croceilyticus]PNZ66248.1 sugar kinase [Staphylococcus croceilyticus]TGA80578.1 sugar kinase [Staphylococcus croceilyticus]
MKFITLGEIMMRLSPEGFGTITGAKQFDVNYGGAEMNVAVGLSSLGIDCTMLTALPKNLLGDTVIMNLRKYNIHTQFVERNDGRLGMYFLEKGFSVRSSQVIYDRQNSVFSNTTFDDYDIEQALADHQWFHFTGITPAINEDMFDLVKQTLELAKEKGMFVSCDLNFRAALWDFETARLKMSQLLPNVDLIFGYEPLSLPDDQNNDKKDGLDRLANIETLEPILKEIQEKYDIKYIAFTQRKNFSSTRNRLQGFLYTKDAVYQSEQYEVEIIDRVGTGDAFSVGIIYGLINGLDKDETVEFGIKNALYKHTVEGDHAPSNFEVINSIQPDTQDIKR